MSTDSAGGAALVGVKAPVIKAHGNSSPEAIVSTIRQIHRMLETDVTGQLVKHFEDKTNKKLYHNGKAFLLVVFCSTHF